MSVKRDHPWRRIQHPKDFEWWAFSNPAERQRVEQRYRRSRKAVKEGK